MVLDATRQPSTASIHITNLEKGLQPGSGVAESISERRTFPSQTQCPSAAGVRNEAVISTCARLLYPHPSPPLRSPVNPKGSSREGESSSQHHTTDGRNHQREGGRWMMHKLSHAGYPFPLLVHRETASFVPSLDSSFVSHMGKLPRATMTMPTRIA